ncbi:MAG: rRNA maturation RNase YbeY [Patescibacteria group bacterium]
MLEITNKTKQKINQKTTIAVAEGLLNFYKKKNQEVSLVIIGDKKMQSLNNNFRGLNKTTDVLSFSALKQLSDFRKRPKEQPIGGKIIKGQSVRSKAILHNISFDIPPVFLGEIFINIQEAARTKKYQEIFNKTKSRDYIFYFLLVHGLLHLLGYDDQTEKSRQAMIILGERYLSGFFKEKVI